MKVLENLENYDIPSGYHLTPEQEDQLAADVKDIVNALIPIRESKLKTRKYFNTHLRYTSNVKDYLSLPDTPEDKYEFGESYKPLPGEYTWYSEVLHPVLLQVLSIDDGIFGYASNLINEDMEKRDRNGHRYWIRYSDAAIKFCQKFDIDEIRAKAKSIKDHTQRMSYLNEIETDYKIYDGLSRDEEEWLCETVGNKFTSLISEAKTEYELWKDKKSAKDEPIPAVTIPVTPVESDPYGVPEPTDVFYNPEKITGGRFSPAELRMDYSFVWRQHFNSPIFAEEIEKSFQECFLNERDLTWNNETLNRVSNLISSLYDDFSSRIEAIYGFENREYNKKINQWIIETRRIIDEAYRKNSTVQYYFVEDAGGGYPEFDSTDTRDYKQYLYQRVVESAVLGFPSYNTIMPEAFAKMIYYNFWGKDYEKEAAKFRGKVGLAQDQRAMVFQNANIARLKEIVQNRFISYENEYTSDLPILSADEEETHPYIEMPAFFQEQFSDFIERLHSVSTDKIQIDKAIIVWLCDLMTRIARLEVDTMDNIRDNDRKADQRRDACDYFYNQCCLFPLQEMLQNYYADCEAVGFISEVESEEETEPDEAKKDEPKHKYSPKGMPENLYSDLFAVMESYGANSGLTQEQFIERIENADVETLFVYRQMTRIKYILIQLKKYFPDEWCDEICSKSGKKREELFRGYNLDKAFQRDISGIF